MLNPRQNSDYIQLRKAIKNKDKVKAQYLIRNNVDVNNPNAKGDTLLHLVIIRFEDVDIMTMLLDREANIHATNHNNEKPLDVAIQNNKTQAALLLISKGALVGEDLNKLLLKTIEKKNYTIFKNLIDNRTQYNQTVDFKTLFNIAISQGRPKILEEIRRHRRFLKPFDKYIPREVVIKPGLKYKKCVELLLKWKFTINPYSNHDKDFIYAAVENGHLQIVIQLLKFGIDVNLVNSGTGLSLLKVACWNNHHEIVKNLLKHNACVNIATHTNYETLYNPSHRYYKHYGFIDSLSSYTKNDLDNLTCLHIAVFQSDSIITKLLLRYGAKITDDPKFFNITCIAVRKNCEEIVRIFLDQGVDVNGIDPQERSLLHFCVFVSCERQDSKYNIAKLLLEKGAAIHIQIPGNSLTFEAVKNRHRRIAQLFLDYNANIQYISQDGDTLLHKAIENDFDVEFIRILLKRNSPVDVLNNNMYTPLIIACKTRLNNQFEIIKALLHWNANVNCPVNILTALLHCEQKINFNSANDRGQTPLHFVCEHRSDMTASIIKLLLEHNANIEAVDAKGWTPLFVACKNDNDVAVKCLLDHHANVNRTDLENLTPLFIAAQYRRYNSNVVKILLEHKVNVHCMNKQGKSIIHIIARNRRTELIEHFVHTQVNFNSVNKEGDTPLHIAVESEWVDVAKNLIKYGANINILDKKNQTPLQIAVSKMSMFRSKLDSYRDHRDRSHSRDNSDDDGYDTEFYLMDSSISKEILNILKIQVVKLKTAGLKVNKQNLNIVYNSNYDSDNELSDDEDMDYNINVLRLEVKCAREIEKMRTESIGINDNTLYNLLQKNVHLMSRLVKNKKIRQTLELKVYDKKFPLYIDIIRSRFRDAKLRYRLMNSAKLYFSLNVCPRLSDDCVDAVFSHLNLKEIKMFIRAMKPVNE